METVEGVSWTHLTPVNKLMDQQTTNCTEYQKEAFNLLILKMRMIRVGQRTIWASTPSPAGSLKIIKELTQTTKFKFPVIRKRAWTNWMYNNCHYQIMKIVKEKYELSILNLHMVSVVKTYIWTILGKQLAIINLNSKLEYHQLKISDTVQIISQLTKILLRQRITFSIWITYFRMMRKEWEIQ